MEPSTDSFRPQTPLRSRLGARRSAPESILSYFEFTYTDVYPSPATTFMSSETFLKNSIELKELISSLKEEDQSWIKPSTDSFCLIFQKAFDLKAQV
jgi:hypothetical protein